MCLVLDGLYRETVRVDRCAKASPAFSVNLSNMGPGVFSSQTWC